jgi:hypothetical protein
MTTLTDLKIYLLNAVALAFNFTQIDLTLKILLTAVAIGYTLQKWYIMNEERKLKKQMQKYEDAATGKAESKKASKNTIVKNGIVRKTKEVRDDLHSS